MEPKLKKKTFPAPLNEFGGITLPKAKKGMTIHSFSLDTDFDNMQPTMTIWYEERELTKEQKLVLLSRKRNLN